MRFSKSLDGVDRANLHAYVRVERGEVSMLRELAKSEGFSSLRDFLNDCLRDGIFAVQARRNEDQDRHEIEDQQ